MEIGEEGFQEEELNKQIVEVRSEKSDNTKPTDSVEV